MSNAARRTSDRSGAAYGTPGAALAAWVGVGLGRACAPLHPSPTSGPATISSRTARRSCLTGTGPWRRKTTWAARDDSGLSALRSPDAGHQTPAHLARVLLVAGKPSAEHPLLEHDP